MRRYFKILFCQLLNLICQVSSYKKSSLAALLLAVLLLPFPWRIFLPVSRYNAAKREYFIKDFTKTVFFYLATCGSGIFVGSSAIPKRRFRSRIIVRPNLRLLRGKSLQSRVLRLRYLTADAFPVLLPDRSRFLPLFLKLRICSTQKKILPYPEKLYSVLLPTSKSTAKSDALENYISSANLSLAGCSSAEPDSVSVGGCKLSKK